MEVVHRLDADERIEENCGRLLWVGCSRCAHREWCYRDRKHEPLRVDGNVVRHEPGVLLKDMRLPGGCGNCGSRAHSTELCYRRKS